MHKKVLILSLTFSFFIFFAQNTKSNKLEKLDEIHIFTNEWLNVPYKYGGNKKSGIDCSALTKIFYKHVYGKNVPRTAYRQYKSFKRVPKKQLKRGDLVFFKTKSKRPNHVGIYLGNGKFVHASTKLGVTINSLNEKYYAKRFLSGGRKS